MEGQFLAQGKLSILTKKKKKKKEVKLVAVKEIDRGLMIIK